MKTNIPVSDLPVMKACCKTCPFRQDTNGREQDPRLAAQVTQRTLFQAQQICHGTEGKNRCKGSYDHNKTIYDRMGLVHLLKS